MAGMQRSSLPEIDAIPYPIIMRLIRSRHMRGITFLGWTVNIFVACLTIITTEATL